MKTLKNSRLSSAKLSGYNSNEIHDMDSPIPLSIQDLVNNPPKIIDVLPSAGKLGSEDNIRSQLIAQALLNKL